MSCRWEPLLIFEKKGNGEMAAAAAEKDLDALDDMSNQQLVDAMLRAKNERRRAESDVQLLANRLAHLRAEEEKARRRSRRPRSARASST